MLLPGTVCLVAGASNIGKTLLGQQMLTAIALGREWLGRATEQARCLAVFCEDRPDQLDRRALAIAEHYEVHPSVLEREFAWDAREDRDSVLWDTEFGRGKPTEFWFQLFGGRAGQPGLIAEDGYRVVLLDTAAAMFRLNHNDTGQVNAAMRALVREAVRNNIVIVLNTHPSRAAAGSYGGSQQWIAASRFAFNLARPKPPQGMDEEDMAYGDAGLQRVFRGLGSNYVANSRPERWRWQGGVFVLDDAAEPRPERRTFGVAERTEIRYRLLIGCKRAMQHGVLVAADVLAARSLPNLARAYGDVEIRHVPLNILYEAQQALLDAGQLVMVRVGSRCLVRPADASYQGEEAWLLTP